jgi:hypothetical protein
MPKGKPEKQYGRIWELTPPSRRKPYKGHLEWKRVYGPNNEGFMLFKILPLKKKIVKQEEA